MKQPETVLAYALHYFRRPHIHPETEIKQTVDGRLKRSLDRRQFCFISALFHDVRRA